MSQPDTGTDKDVETVREAWEHLSKEAEVTFLAALTRIEARLAAAEARAERLTNEARNRKHYSDNPRTMLHSWEDSKPLRDIGGTCGLCDAAALASPSDTPAQPQEERP